MNLGAFEAPPHHVRPHGLNLPSSTSAVRFCRYESTSAGTSVVPGHEPNAVVPSLSSSTVAAYGFGGRYCTSFACMPYSPCIAWKPPLKPATTRRMISGERGIIPGPASPVALTGSTVPASMCSAIWRGSHIVT